MFETGGGGGGGLLGGGRGGDRVFWGDGVGVGAEPESSLDSPPPVILPIELLDPSFPARPSVRGEVVWDRKGGGRVLWRGGTRAGAMPASLPEMHPPEVCAIELLDPFFTARPSVRAEVVLERRGGGQVVWSPPLPERYLIELLDTVWPARPFVGWEVVRD